MPLRYPNPKIERRIRNLGFRMTPQRELILKAVARQGEHATFDAILEDVRRTAPPPPRQRCHGVSQPGELQPLSLDPRQ